MHYQHVLPIRTYSLTNSRAHWAAKAKRARAARAECVVIPREIALPCVVTLTRIAPRELDDDNLRGALKSVRDGVAARLGVDDRDPRVRWEYTQRKAGVREYAVVVEIVGIDQEAKAA